VTAQRPFAEVVEELTRLDAAATPGPWEHDADGAVPGVDPQADDVSIWAGDHCLANIGDWSEQTVQLIWDDAVKANPSWANGFYTSQTLASFAGRKRNAVQLQDADDARLIVTMRNALPLLLSRLASREAVFEAAVANVAAWDSSSMVYLQDMSEEEQEETLQNARDSFAALRAAIEAARALDAAGE